VFLPACAVLVIGVAFQWEGTQGEADGVPTRLDAVGRLGVNDGRSRDSGTLPSLWSTSLSSVIEAVAFQWEGTQPNSVDVYGVPLPGAEWAKGNATEDPGVETRRAFQPGAQALRAARSLKLEIIGTPTYFGESGRNSKVPPVDIQKLQTADHFASAGKPIVDYAALAALDARDHPGVTEAIVTAAATGRVQALGGSLSEAEMDALLEVTGWPVEWRVEAKAIAWCESRYRPEAVGDGGNSLGLFQLWYGWFAPAGYSVEQAYDPVTNSRVALYVRTTRGRWGGGGGWSCAGLNGIE